MKRATNTRLKCVMVIAGIVASLSSCGRSGSAPDAPIDAIAFVRQVPSEEPTLELVSASGGSTRRIGRKLGGLDGIHWSPDGEHLLMMRGGQMVLMDPNGTHKREIAGKAGIGSFDTWFPDGKRIAIAWTGQTRVNKVTSVVDIATQKWQPFVTGEDLDFSPDGTKVAYETCFDDANGEFDCDLMLADADGSNVRPLVVGPGFDEFVRWSPDGKRVAFLRLSAGSDKRELLVADADGTKERVIDSGDIGSPPHWFADGSRVSYVSDGTQFIVNVDGPTDRKPTNFACPAQWSPSESKVLYAKPCDEYADLYVANADGSNPVKVADRAGLATWRPVGR